MSMKRKVQERGRRVQQEVLHNRKVREREICRKMD